MEDIIINWQPDYLQNDLVKITPLKEADFDRLYVIASDPLIWEQHPSNDRYVKEVFQSYFNGAMSSKTAFLITDNTTNNVIGSTRYYDFKPNDSSIAIGFTFLSRKYWGGHYNGASKELLLGYAFQFVDKVFFHIGATNFRSQKATAKIGAKKVGEILNETQGIKNLTYEYAIEVLSDRQSLETLRALNR